MMEECIHELTLDTCTMCLKKDKKPIELSGYSDPFKAKYAGKCRSCGDDIQEGDWICYNGQIVVCKDCAEI